LVLSDTADFLYKTTDYYHPASDQSLLWNDPALGIAWPLQGFTPQLSAKDMAGKLLSQITLLPEYARSSSSPAVPVLSAQPLSVNLSATHRTM
jgi:hypothetical protein